VAADLTVTFACPKLPHLLPPAEALVGELRVVEMGIPPWAVEAEDSRLEVVEEPQAASLLPEREPAAHKGDFGRVLVVAGSVGMAGAAALVARSAQRIGAGLVTVAAPGAVRPEVAVLSPETLTASLASSEAGSLGVGAAEGALELASAADVLALGPGVGNDPVTAGQVREIVAGCDRPLVLDADGLNAYGPDHADRLEGGERPLVLTPHPGEMAGLLGSSTAEVQADRLEAVRRCADRHGATVVLKGHRSLVAVPGGRAWVNPTGNQGMATGGSGDVLTGMIAGLMAQGLPALEAALLGVFAHGLAGDLAAETGCEAALVAGDLIEALPAVLDRLAATAEAEPLP
jgi:NAD(P)H-hydrate epimerase